MTPQDYTATTAATTPMPATAAPGAAFRGPVTAPYIERPMSGFSGHGPDTSKLDILAVIFAAIMVLGPMVPMAMSHSYRSTMTTTGS